MLDMPTVLPVSDLRYKHREVFDKLDQGPVILAQRSREAAVLVSVEEWRKIAKRIGMLEQRERTRVADEQFAAIKAGGLSAINASRRPGEIRP
ncbi:type II toxin-antitoxin system prevent-host-death family antitoxin [Chloroflexi bacterium TSY]|nr:type II toxin-antitoxin system prevent-host-death family antitoxin [Chloroflexi bacterium TSY]MBV7336626.1 type II toxin-antitoxin system prevent-host-death family antitoxin [Chloroflexi bacterium TSY]